MGPGDKEMLAWLRKGLLLWSFTWWLEGFSFSGHVKLRALVPCRLLDECDLWFFVTCDSLVTSLQYGSMLHQIKQVRRASEVEWVNQDGRHSHLWSNWKVTSHPFDHIHFIRGKSLACSHTQLEGVALSCEHQKMEISRCHFRSYLPEDVSHAFPILGTCPGFF